MTAIEAKMQIQAIPEKIWDQLSEPDREAMEMAFTALQAQDSPKPKAESVQNVQKEDLISRKEAIYAECEVCQIAPKKERGHNCTYYVHGCKEIECLRELQSAQPEPCEDAVSRDSVKFLLCKETCHPGAFCPDGFCREICEKVDALPSATQKQRMVEWIPVSERLPEYGVAVLTYDGHCFCVEKRIPTIRDDEGEPITGDWWVSDDYDEYDGDYYPNLRDGACIAWMPLPEPTRLEND